MSKLSNKLQSQNGFSSAAFSPDYDSETLRRAAKKNREAAKKLFVEGKLLRRTESTRQYPDSNNRKSLSSLPTSTNSSFRVSNSKTPPPYAEIENLRKVNSDSEEFQNAPSSPANSVFSNASFVLETDIDSFTTTAKLDTRCNSHVTHPPTTPGSPAGSVRGSTSTIGSPSARRNPPSPRFVHTESTRPNNGYNGGAGRYPPSPGWQEPEPHAVTVASYTTPLGASRACRNGWLESEGNGHVRSASYSTLSDSGYQNGSVTSVHSRNMGSETVCFLFKIYR